MSGVNQASRLRTLLGDCEDLGVDLVAELGAAPVFERAALAYDWPSWGRPKQLIESGDWQSYGFLTGRGWGKTRAIAEWVHGEAMSGRAMRIALIAQNEDKTREVLVEGASGLLMIAPEHERPRFEKNRLLWCNGAQAFLYTPEVPGALRGPEHDLAWASELVAWPPSSREEAWGNLRKGVRTGYARTVWDSTPKRRHPMIRMLIERATARPALHRLVRGATIENADWLNIVEVADWYAEYGGTQRGREELEGEFFDDDESALWKQAWIDAQRRHMPTVLLRRVLSLDPAISTRKATDQTGLVDVGLGLDDQVFVLDDLTGKHSWEAWGALVVRLYFERGCDCIVVERNRGGDAVAANIRAHARDRGITVEVVGEEVRTQHVGGVIFVKEVWARRGKDVRAEPVATYYERGRVSHLLGAELTALEDLMTTWSPKPGEKSPDGMDALVHGIYELARLGDSMIGAVASKGLARVIQHTHAGARPRPALVGHAVRIGGRSVTRL